jgi:hypothetical protein
MLACTLTTQPTPESAPLPLQSEVSVSSVDTGLADLDSYRAHLIVRFDGLRNGQPTGGQIESLTEIIRQPPAYHHYLKVNVITPTLNISNGVSEFYQVGNRVYAKKGGDASWLTFTTQSDPPASFTSEDMGFLQLTRLIILPATVSAPPESELLNGLNVRHYRFNETDLPPSNILFEQAQGDFWIAAHGNFLMQYVISATVRLATPLPQAHLFDQGQLNLRYTLTEVNQQFEIKPPSLETVLSPNQLSRLPRLPDAELITVFPTLIEYTSAISAISATMFYRDRLTTLGWTEADNSEIFTEKSRLQFSKNNEKLTIMISPTGDPEKVEVLLDFNGQP